jgi:LacI family transcriptional regulator
MHLLQQGNKRIFHVSGPDHITIYRSRKTGYIDAIHAVRRNRISIPGDLVVSGFANEPFTAFPEPSLTAVDQRGEIMGRGEAEMFPGCEKEQSGLTGCKQQVIKPEGIIRNSSL